MENNRDVLKFFITYLNNPKSPIISKEEITNNYSKLCSLLNICNTSYYNDGTSLLSDGEYDQLLDLLKTYEHMLPSIKSKDSPTSKIGESSLIKKGDHPFEHTPKMYSLEKIHNSDDIQNWIMSVAKKLKKDFTVSVGKKIDGVAVKLIYERLPDMSKAMLTHCVLRGDGKTGTDIIYHIKRIYKAGKYVAGIPLEIEVNKPDDIWWEGYITDHVVTPDYLEITGEMYLPREQLVNINTAIVHSSLPSSSTDIKTKEPYKSPRHATVGLINARLLHYLCFDVHGINSCRNEDGEYFTDVEEGLTWLDATCGFRVSTGEKVKINHTKPDITHILTLINAITQRRDILPMDIDGVVLKVIDTSQQDALGYTRKYPKWAMAYKFIPTTMTSVLKDVQWSMSRTGTLTPIAVFEPIVIKHVTYAKAALYNWAYMDALNLKHEDIITIKRAGDVIPIVTGVNTPKNVDGTSIKDGRRSIKAPTHCPYCKTTLHRDHRQLYCTNSYCKEVLKLKFLYLIGKKVFDLKYLRLQGAELLEVLIKKGYLKNTEDIFNLDFKILKAHMKKPIDISDDKFKERINKIISEINICKQERLNVTNLLLSLNIPNISESFIEKFVVIYDVKKLPDIVQLYSNKEISSLSMVSFKMHMEDSTIRNTISSLLPFVSFK